MNSVEELCFKIEIKRTGDCSYIDERDYLLAKQEAVTRGYKILENYYDPVNMLMVLKIEK